MIEELSNINREWLQLLSRKSLEDLAWQEKEIIEKLKAELAQALDSNDELKDNAERIEEILSRLKKLLFAKRSERSDRGENRGSTGRGGALPLENFPVNVTQMLK